MEAITETFKVIFSKNGGGSIIDVSSIAMNEMIVKSQKKEEKVEKRENNKKQIDYLNKLYNDLKKYNTEIDAVMKEMKILYLKKNNNKISQNLITKEIKLIENKFNKIYVNILNTYNQFNNINIKFSKNKINEVIEKINNIINLYKRYKGEILNKQKVKHTIYFKPI